MISHTVRSSRAMAAVICSGWACHRRTRSTSGHRAQPFCSMDSQPWRVIPDAWCRNRSPHPGDRIAATFDTALIELESGGPSWTSGARTRSTGDSRMAGRRGSRSTRGTRHPNEGFVTGRRFACTEARRVSGGEDRLHVRFGVGAIIPDGDAKIGAGNGVVYSPYCLKTTVRRWRRLRSLPVLCSERICA